MKPRPGVHRVVLAVFRTPFKHRGEFAGRAGAVVWHMRVKGGWHARTKRFIHGARIRRCRSLSIDTIRKSSRILDDSNDAPLETDYRCDHPSNARGEPETRPLVCFVQGQQVDSRLDDSHDQYETHDANEWRQLHMNGQCGLNRGISGGHHKALRSVSRMLESSSIPF